MGTSVTFNTGPGAEITQDQLDQITADVLAQIGTVGPVPTLANDPVDFNNPNTPRLWINGGQVKYYDGAQVHILDNKGDNLLSDLSGNIISND